MSRVFEYDETAVEYLASKDVRLARAMQAVGHIEREMDDEGLFAAIVHHIVAQQISNAALDTVWGRVRALVPDLTPQAICTLSVDELQSCGMTFVKARNICAIAERVASGDFDLDAVREMSDEDAITALSTLPGIGVWTAEMLLLFCLGRPDILSFGDLAILRGMRMVYHHRRITREMFERYRRRFSPYGSVASLYFWRIARGDIPGYERDFAPKKRQKKPCRE